MADPTSATARRRQRAQILKARRASGKMKPVVSDALKKKRAEVQRLKKEKLAMKKNLDKEKAEMKKQVREAKKKIDDERKRAALLEKELRKQRANAKKKATETSKQNTCIDAHLKALHERMVSAVPSPAKIKTLTNNDFTLRRETMSSVWTALRKYLVTCHKKHFESVKRTRVKKKTSAKSAFDAGAPAFRQRNMHVPDIGVDIDEEDFENVTAKLFPNDPRPTAKSKDKSKKKKKLSPVFVGPIK
ncbi:unnamed protein product [Sphacelaria rigidula]